MGNGITRAGCALALATVSPLVAQSCTTRILCIGDSITEGGQGYSSYRHDLWHLLRANGCAIDMLGPRNGVQNGAVPEACAFDMDHAATWAMRLAPVVQNPPSTAGVDVALILFGAGDIYDVLGAPSPWGTPAFAASYVQGQLQALVDALNASSTPPAVILVGTVLPAALPPRNQTDVDSAISQANTLIWGMDGQANVTGVDLFTGVAINQHTYDGVHPNTAGEAQIAAAWASTLAALTTASPPSATAGVYGRPCPPPQRSPITLTVTPVPTQSTTVTATFGNLLASDTVFTLLGFSAVASGWLTAGDPCYQLVDQPTASGPFTGSAVTWSTTVPSSGLLGAQLFLQLVGTDGQSEPLASN